MDEASQNSFYEDDLPVSGTITEVKSHLKDEGLFTFKSACWQLKEETPEPIRNEPRATDVSNFRVPVCDDQKCQLEVQQDLYHTTSVSTSLVQEHRTVPSIDMCDERPSMADNFKNLKTTSKGFQYFAEEQLKSSEDNKGKSETFQDELYLNWNAPSHFELMNKVPTDWPGIGVKPPVRENKVPTGWPGIGVKSPVRENKVTPHQTTLSLFTMAKQAHLLSEEQLEQINVPQHNEHFDQYCRSILKRSSPSNEAFGSSAEKFAKTDLDIEIKNSSEDGEFFTQVEAFDDCKDDSCICADQEVPIQYEEETSNSTGQAVEAVDEKMSSKPVSSIGERPYFNSESNTLNRQSSTGDHLHIGKASLYEEPVNIEGPCTKFFCLKFQKDQGHLLSVNSPEKEDSSVNGAAKTSSVNSEHEVGEPHLTDQLEKNSELLEKQQIKKNTNKEEPSHNEVQVVLSQSPITYNIECKYPPLPEKAPYDTGLCSSLRAIDERALITDPLDDVDSSPLQLRRDLLQAEILLYEREEVDDRAHCDAFPPNTVTSQDLESFTSSIPVKNLSDRSSRHAESFDKVQLGQYLDKPMNETLAALTEKDPNPISKVWLASKKNEHNALNSIATDVFPLRATYDETLPGNMQTEGPTNQREMETISNFPGQENDNVNAIAPPTNGSLMDNDDDKENKRDFSYGNQGSIKLGESSEMKGEKKSKSSHLDKSDQFRTEVESKMIDMDGPELLQFAMIFVQGAMKKSQIVPSRNELLKRDEDRKSMSVATPAFLWKSTLSYHNQQAPAVGPTNAETSNEPGSKVNEDSDNRNADHNEGATQLIRPLPKTTCNRALRLGLSRKHSNKRLYPYSKKHSNENQADSHITLAKGNGEKY